MVGSVSSLYLILEYQKTLTPPRWVTSVFSRAMCSGPTGDSGRLGMARANCSWPGIYSWPGCGGPTVDLQLAWLWMARHLQLARASCGP